MSFTVEIVNGSGKPGRAYNVFSEAVKLGVNTEGTPLSVVWHRTPAIGEDQSELFVFENTFYGLVGTKRNNQISVRETKKVTIGSHMNNGSILLVDKASTFKTYTADDIDTPDINEFKIATNQSLPEGTNYVVGVARAKEDDSGATKAAPVAVVTLKPRSTYTFIVSKALYIKATSYAASTVQTAPTDKDDQAVRVEFTGPMKKAVVTEDPNGHFSVSYSRGD